MGFQHENDVSGILDETHRGGPEPRGAGGGRTRWRRTGAGAAPPCADPGTWCSGRPASAAERPDSGPRAAGCSTDCTPPPGHTGSLQGQASGETRDITHIRHLVLKMKSCVSRPHKHQSAITRNQDVNSRRVLITGRALPPAATRGPRVCAPRVCARAHRQTARAASSPAAPRSAALRSAGSSGR